MLLLLELLFVLKTGVTAASKQVSSLGLVLRTLGVRTGVASLRTELPLFNTVAGCGTLATAAA